MSFRITGLPAQPFAHLFGLSDAELARHGAIRLPTREGDAHPDRIELTDARPGESVLLVNHEHQPADTPYRSRHAVFVREHAGTPFDAVDEVPGMLSRRLLSLRAFDAAGMMVDADIADGTALEPLIERLLARPDTAYIHAHFARRGCYAALIRRA
ncbi:DUF1203 domain-containing protein [Roseateles saccharophilus]|uniref:Uncharacterized protein DUF1203 n=1 Tax=Roseateles saccharophilus TaxID=304 RepID=A0A4R3VEG2_ROSSA|nr:DUF1203 domain-containing protein [Roseateles saccharophilus]MDG0832982.1 DUF1203 domain-containing protein [Roseateles saccharophilus]TCV02074.1 uncharacterized protein DUF1203 [Roseateles saccharophilus]